LWGGELASWDLGGRDTISRAFDDGSQPPLCFLILHFARWIFGDSEWALRLASAIAGWLCIPAIYLLGKKLYSEREGVMAALFLAVLWRPVYYSQEARPYAMLILLSILTSYFWWDLMQGLRYRGELPKSEAVWYVACAVLCTYTHYFGLLLVLLQAAALTALAFDGLRKVALVYAPAVLAFLPWLPGMVNQVSNGGQAGHGQAALQALPAFFQFLFGRSSLVALAAWTLLCFLLLRGRNDVRPRRKGAGVQPGLLLAAWAVGPFVVSYAASQNSAGMLTDETSWSRSQPSTCWLRTPSPARSRAGRPGYSRQQWPPGWQRCHSPICSSQWTTTPSLLKSTSATPPPTWPPTEMTAPSSSAATPTTGSTTIWLPETASRLARAGTSRKYKAE
jgi:mannosyltransferase